MDDVMSRPGMLGFPVDLEADPQPLPPLPSRIKRRSWESASYDLAIDYLVKGVLDTGGFSVAYGESGAGKSFWALDLAAHVAIGRDWRGRRVRKTGVVYVAAEGQGGFEKRIAAFRMADAGAGGHVRTQADKSKVSGRVPFEYIPQALDLGSRGSPDVEALIDEIALIGDEMGQPVGLIIVDTLSRCFGGGEENSSEAMTRFIGNIDRIRQETGAHVMIIHHAGKDTTRGARGHSSLFAAADAVISIARTGADTADTGGQTGQDAGCPASPIVATVVKCKDDAAGATFAFRLRQVHLGIDQDGDAVTSCVCEEIDAPVKRAKRLTDNEALALETLADTIATEGEPLPQGAKFPTGGHHRGANLSAFRRDFIARVLSGQKGDTADRTFRRLKSKLQRLGLIGVYGDWIWLPGQGGQGRTTSDLSGRASRAGGADKPDTPLKGCPVSGPPSAPSAADVRMPRGMM